LAGYHEILRVYDDVSPQMQSWAKTIREEILAEVAAKQA
jgi:hypothetical protein